jgi:high-affinity iron transporter
MKTDSLKNTFLLPLLLLFNIVAFASNENARALIHALSYIEGDYGNAVKDGKIISEVEYEEMHEFAENIIAFYADFSASLSSEDTLLYGAKVRALHRDIDQKKDAEQVSVTASFLKKEFIRISKVATAPTVYPNILNGAKVYAADCAKCHGATGFGDGAEGVELNPLPRNFHEEERMEELSPFAVFNTVRLGIQGTGMKAFPTLSDAEVWDVAFYILSLRHSTKSTDGESIATIPLAEIASLNEEELEEKYELSETAIAALRLQQPAQANNTFLNIALKHLDEALAAYKNADYKKAQALAATAYLEGVEAVEVPLKSVNPSLAERLEREMMQVRILVKNQAEEAMVELAVQTAKKSIADAAKELESKQYSFLMAFWMTLAILLREGLEAFLVIMTILAVLGKAGLHHQKKFIHAGWVVAILIGFGLWFLSEKLLTVGFANIEILEGVISFTAVAMLLYIGFWLHGKSNAESWKKYVEGLVKSAASNSSALGLAGVAFFVVFREVFESVLFLSALNMESKGTQSLALGVGFVVAFLLVMVFAVITLKFSAKLPIQKLFKISSIMMGILAVVLAGKGTRAFQETGLLDVHYLQFPEVELLGIFPTVETLSAQLIIAVVVIALMKFASKK